MIVGAAPAERAGAASAIAETGSEFGGALGIAILGSIANTAYRGAINMSGLGLGGPARGQAEESIGSAAQVATHAARSGVVRDRAATAFADAFHVTSFVSIGIVLVAAAAILLVRRPAVSTGEEFGDEPFELEFALAGVGAGQPTE
jgi:DHA2 family multidrug resistance protein-like MFS transporter